MTCTLNHQVSCVVHTKAYCRAACWPRLFYNRLLMVNVLKETGLVFSVICIKCTKLQARSLLPHTHCPVHATPHIDQQCEFLGLFCYWECS